MYSQHAIKRKITVKDEKHEHWVDFASDKYSKQLIEEVKRVLAITLVFIPLPVFWALYDQQVRTHYLNLKETIQYYVSIRVRDGLFKRLE